MPDNLIYSDPSVREAKSIKVVCPSGTMFVIIMDDLAGNPERIEIHIGKSGSNMMAWAFSIAELANLVLKAGGSLEDIISKLSNTVSDKISRHERITIRSDIDGFVFALYRYKEEKNRERYKSRGKRPKLRPRYI